MACGEEIGLEVASETWMVKWYRAPAPQVLASTAASGDPSHLGKVGWQCGEERREGRGPLRED